MSVFNTLIQRLAPDWVRARVLAVYLFVFQGSMAIGSVLWGALAERSGLEKALLTSAVGIAACLLLRLHFSLPEPSTTLDVWNHWPRPTMFVEPEPDDGPVLVTVEYKIAPIEATEFLAAIHKYQRFVAVTAQCVGAFTMTPNPQGRDLPRRFLGGTPAATRPIYNCRPDR